MSRVRTYGVVSDRTRPDDLDLQHIWLGHGYFLGRNKKACEHARLIICHCRIASSSALKFSCVKGRQMAAGTRHKLLEAPGMSSTLVSKNICGM